MSKFVPVSHERWAEMVKAQAENDRLKAEVAELKLQPDPLTAYLYAAELAKEEMRKLKAAAHAWRQVPGLPGYLVSQDGRLAREVKVRTNKNGTRFARVSIKGVQRVVRL